MVGFVSYNVDNDKSFRRNIDKAVKQVGDLRFAMGEISRDIFKNTKKNFILKGDGQYPPLSPKYAKYKAKVVPAKPILVFGGRLKRSVIGSGNADSIRKIGKQSLVQGSEVEYANWVQEGTKNEDGTEKMPERKFLFIDDAQSIRLERIIADYVESRLEVLGNVK